jgi:hypothetical protein
MGLLGDEAQVEAQFGPFGGSATLDARLVHSFSLFGDRVSVSATKAHGLHRTYHRHRNHFGRTRWDS